jgi:hypothetical protein
MGEDAAMPSHWSRFVSVAKDVARGFDAAFPRYVLPASCLATLIVALVAQAWWVAVATLTLLVVSMLVLRLYGDVLVRVGAAVVQGKIHSMGTPPTAPTKGPVVVGTAKVPPPKKTD